ncbi:hypothetical protein MJO28_009246 [Puccinia striiformis f. sp. tritici]|uniref:Uncharacterized protein n=1 Tax=Puccinia striiformis f. sp. tritici TaxID=168172 RepID=A0ACC0E795_9BASI|nr:hypothetical protein MJO28_009246 [Puccinia striiformis f. sp. tritici]
MNSLTFRQPVFQKNQWLVSIWSPRTWLKGISCVFPVKSCYKYLCHLDIPFISPETQADWKQRMLGVRAPVSSSQLFADCGAVH